MIKKNDFLLKKKTVLNNGKHEFVVYHTYTDSYESSFLWKTEIGIDPWRYVFLSRAIRQPLPQVQGLAYMYDKWQMVKVPISSKCNLSLNCNNLASDSTVLRSILINVLQFIGTF